ncbi:MAG: glycoside hydrolase family 26 protein [Clostridia bacterium]|nr:glycoside hydrolase family 26 protein [Clostridia bacterium]
MIFKNFLKKTKELFGGIIHKTDSFWEKLVKRLKPLADKCEPLKKKLNPVWKKLEPAAVLVGRFLLAVLKSKKLWIPLIAFVVVFGGYNKICEYYFTNPDAYFWLSDEVNKRYPDQMRYKYYYVNNVLQYELEEHDLDTNDVKEIQVGDNRKFMINHSRGFAMEFPRDVTFDFTAGHEFIVAKDDKYSIVVSKEFSPYERTRYYIRDYLNKFLLDERYREQNKIVVHKNSVEKINDFWVQVLCVSRTPAPNSPIKQNTYAYCYIYDKEQRYYRIMVKGEKYDDEFLDTIYKMLYSFDLNVEIRGTSKNYTNYEPIEDPNWNEETRDFYRELCNTDKLKWGIYVPQGVRDMRFEEVEKMEEKIDYTFEGMIEYLYLGVEGEDFPLEGMKKAYDDGKVVELTLQTATIMNADLDGYSPVFDILDGLWDSKIRKFAQQAKEFDHPFLFRLNNEMNSDWTSYCSSTMMNDPELYVTIWRRFYDIFHEEGVDNAIWVFNPNNITFPPCGYNDPMAYYPGNGYVHVFGVTGYNTGTYYEKQNAEKWREFEELYDECDKLFLENYGKFPWIITEFASSSIGGDKVQWIKNMFEVLPKYKNIKMAFWFNSADWDPAYPKETVVSRPYWLDETEETLKAFGEGVKNE